jgi:RNA polymerase sigma-70 factor (ECF subfamily)
VGSGQAAEDLAQEALMRAYKGLATLEAPEKFGTWLFGIAHRVCLDWLNRKERTHVSLDAEPAVKEPSSERQDQIDMLMAAVEALPEEYREVLMLYYYNDVRYSDLAKQLGVSSATINMRLTKARQMLRARLKGGSHGL